MKLRYWYTLVLLLWVVYLSQSSVLSNTNKTPKYTIEELEALVAKVNRDKVIEAAYYFNYLDTMVVLSKQHKEKQMQSGVWFAGE
jgi:Na+-translocating ferredoxin:NAD+ oxidoreductase RnfG subunit